MMLMVIARSSSGGVAIWDVRRRGSLGRSVGEDDMGPQIEDPRLPPLQL